MNSYLALRCRSEQQVMNEFTKSIAAKDYTKRTAVLLHELTFFYVSTNTDTDGSSAHIHDSVLKDLTTLLTAIKDKREDQRIIKTVMTLLQRIAEQMLFSQELKQTLSMSPAPSPASIAPPTSPRGDKTEAIMHALKSLTDLVAKAEVGNAFPPRRVAAYKLFVVLCAATQQPERPFSITSTIQSSSVWTMLKLTAAAKKKGADKDLPTQLGLLSGAFQVARHTPSPASLESVVPQLVQGAFLPNRHAAATCLRLFDVMPLKVVQAVYAHVSATPSFSLNTTDPLTTIYVLKLCGKITRLPVTSSSSSSSSSSAQNLLDFSFDTTAKPVKRREKAPSGPSIDGSVSSRLSDLLVDICMQKHTFALAAAALTPHASSVSVAAATLAPCTVLLTAIQELALGQVAPKCFEKVRGGLSPFEIASNGVHLILQTHADNPLVLHRVARVVQVVAECLDLTLVEFTAGGGHLDFFSHVTDRMWELATSPTSYQSSCVVRESLIALVWLLPRTPRRSSLSPKTQTQSAVWTRFLVHLRTLSTVPELDRRDIALAMFRRATLFDVDAPLLHRTIAVLVHWYHLHPCQWHSDVALQLWTTLLSDGQPSSDMFASVLAMMDHHVAPSSSSHPAQAQAVQAMKCVALRFLSSPPATTLLLGHPTLAAACQDIVLRLTKFVMLDELIIRRLSVDAMVAMASGGGTPQQQHVHDVLAALDMPSHHHLGIQDIVVPFLRRTSSSTSSSVGPSQKWMMM
ncbi:hypothetical protein H257_06246 [Aphanomyces astaci]|uniref:Uncharacterized protein n=1 Tax=Aphanomyces astaci TaxID=112090 RepID=W4GP19_APHAT|nr:hypothetical protein H257_06246 [Aphanomyces astaci]ETV80759.1 hypothetical protein H257_06246 [Aphanomyces astaci]|eukprot:XP_009829706.1 hypothetical protein H257_06246 [Aphanomyces astaci]